MEVFLHVKNEKRGSLWLVTTARATILSHCTVIFIKANYRLCSSGCDLFTKDKCVLLNTSSVAAHTHTHTHTAHLLAPQSCPPFTVLACLDAACAGVQCCLSPWVVSRPTGAASRRASHPLAVRPSMGVSVVSISWLLSIGSADVLLKSCFHFLWLHTQEWVAESQGKSIFLFF